MSLQLTSPSAWRNRRGGNNLGVAQTLVNIYKGGERMIRGCSNVNICASRDYMPVIFGALPHLIPPVTWAEWRHGLLKKYVWSFHPKSIGFMIHYSPTIGIDMLVGGVAHAQFVRSLDTSRVSDKPFMG